MPIDDPLSYNKNRWNPGHLRRRFYEARKVFLKSPGILQRIRLYLLYRKTIRHWTTDFTIRIDDVCAAPDNKHLPRVPDAGKTIDGYLVTHNGIRIIPGSYVGDQMTSLLARNRGVHEPQEERAFAEVLSWLGDSGSDSYTMVELGSYWAFYSLWFDVTLPNARCYCVEPSSENLEFGRRNFEINDRSADFTQGYVGATASAGNPPMITVDSLVQLKGIEHIHILHSDIQGYELEMLHGADEAIMRQIIDYIFISTHSHFLHYRCLDFLGAAGFKILAEADLLETYSIDGLIVAARNNLNCPNEIPIQRRVV